MIRISQIRLPVRYTQEQLEQKIRRALKLRDGVVFSSRIVRKSIDARRKPEIFYSLTVDVSTAGEEKILKKISDRNIMAVKERVYEIPERASAKSGGGVCGDAGTNYRHPRPVIAGAGPAGLFCAYALVQRGLAPVIVERGKRVEERMRDVEAFWEKGIFDPSSNVQFGEGGAGTFSDGKLNTLVKDPDGRNRYVLETFVRFGAPEEILCESRPHIGTDVLSDIIRNMRLYMEEEGAEFCFGTCLTGYKARDGALVEIELDHKVRMPAEELILATGHSARDTFAMLAEKGQLSMEAKAFAVGLRVEHKQEEINLGQYGALYAGELPAASYKLTAKAGGGRGVYSFCMCPGGFIVPAMTDAAQSVVNGMSPSGRNSAFANSGIVTEVREEDYAHLRGQWGELAGLVYQHQFEVLARENSGAKQVAPAQRVSDFVAGRRSASLPRTSYIPGLVSSRLDEWIPETLAMSLRSGIASFGRKMKGFVTDEAIVVGVESRTSTPVRIPRDPETLMHVEIDGLFPSGEGAGYAGGIVSAALDGEKVADAVVRYLSGLGR